MAQAYTSPDWSSGEGISPSNLQSISNVLQNIVQGTDKAIHNVDLNGSNLVVTYVDGTTETFAISGLKGIASVNKTSSGNVDTYTITYTDGTTYSFNVTNSPSTASDITYDNTTTGMTATNVQDAIDAVFTDVDNGKTLVASAISDKGVPTLATDTFQTMATNISNISGGGSGGTDVSDTTATAADVLTGKVFHTANGARTVGSLVVPNAKSGSITLTTADQTINCGFQPTQVTVCVGAGRTTYFGFGVNTNGTTVGARLAGSSASSGTSPATITLTSTGFKVKALSSSYALAATYSAIG